MMMMMFQAEGGKTRNNFDHFDSGVGEELLKGRRKARTTTTTNRRMNKQKSKSRI